MEFDTSKRYNYWFRKIADIPRASRKEKAVSDFICDFAREHGLEYVQDEVWNVIVRKPASPGYEDVAPLILQAHTDMVCEKNQDCPHDFDTEPLDLYVDEDGWLRARGTTLGSDDGYGVAYILAILEDDTIPHPPLEAVFTVMEEVGLLGAMALKPGMLTAHRMINLDGGGEDTTSVSSSGSISVNYEKTIHYEANPDPAYAIRVRGLKGGHSGGDIHLELGNAIKIAAMILKEAEIEGCQIRLVSFNGGMKYNAIPREADVVFTSTTDFDTLQKEMLYKEQEVRDQLAFSDSGFRLVFEKAEAKERFTAADSEETLNFFYLAPNGFQHKHMGIENLTMASCNLGTASTEGSRLSGIALPRAALDSYNDTNLYQYRLLGELFHVTVTGTGKFSPWAYDPDSRMRKIYADALQKLEGKELKTVATHGGLETGIFRGLVPDMDIICVGPVAEGAHTPEERLDLASYDRVWDLLLEIIRNCH